MFFWSGRNAKERRGFGVKNCLVRKLASLPTGINDILVPLRLPLANKQHATIISAYAPSRGSEGNFYKDLDKLIRSVPRQEKLFLLGDFNADTDHTTWEGVGKCNSNGLLLLRTRAEHELLIVNTVFCVPRRNKTSWMHPRSRHWHLIDFVIT